MGGVWEWVCSEYDEKYRGKEQRCKRDIAHNQQIIRGGSWGVKAKVARVSFRYNFKEVKDLDIGFRLVREKIK